MSKRSVTTVILGEDSFHERFVRRCLLELGFRDRDIRSNTAPAGRGSGVAHVLRGFGRELEAIRRRRARGRCLLIVIVDADTGTTAERRRELEAAAGPSPIEDNDPLAILIPRRSIDTWVLHLNSVPTTETDDYSADRRVSDWIRDAALEFVRQLRQGPPPPRWPPSLREAAGAVARIRAAREA